jgi:histidyl-tRNA synthetase
MGASARTMAVIEDLARHIAYRHNVAEIRFPVVERLSLYKRSTGETSDIVEKQIYLVQRPEESSATSEQALRPEGTPGVVRAYIEAGLDKTDPEQRYFYCGPMFRYERPQKGRLRQFFQFGVELFGRDEPAADAELLIMIDELRKELGLELNFEINSLGDSTCRPFFRQALLKWGHTHLAELCEDCHRRLERNPLRVLDCKIDVVLAETAPKTVDYLCDACKLHFDTVCEFLSDAGVRYRLNPRLVRGLDYYTRTAFEVTSAEVGAQNAIGGGGRYDGLIEALGGAAVAGTGFAIGVDRLALALDGGKFELRPNAALVTLDAAATRAALHLAGEMRALGLRVELLSSQRSLKAQLRRADKLKADYALIIGADEISRGVVQMRDLRQSTQHEVSFSEVAGRVAAIVGDKPRGCGESLAPVADK